MCIRLPAQLLRNVLRPQIVRFGRRNGPLMCEGAEDDDNNFDYDIDGVAPGMSPVNTCPLGMLSPGRDDPRHFKFRCGGA